MCARSRYGGKPQCLVLELTTNRCFSQKAKKIAVITLVVIRSAIPKSFSPLVVGTIMNQVV